MFGAGLNSDIHEVCRQAVKLEIARVKASKEYKYKMSKKEGKEEEEITVLTPLSGIWRSVVQFSCHLQSRPPQAQPPPIEHEEDNYHFCKVPLNPLR